MACDIHAMIEEFVIPPCSSEKSGYWRCSGEVLIMRDYELFAILGNVRNEQDIVSIGENRLLAHLDEKGRFNDSISEISDLFRYWFNRRVCDNHSPSFVTLGELDHYFVAHQYDETVSKETWTTIKEIVSRMKILSHIPHPEYDASPRNPSQIRLTFFFDN